MADMLVKLYHFRGEPSLLANLEAKGVIVRRAMAPEKSVVLGWVEKNFERGWVDECDKAFSHSPISCFVAVKDEKMVGFACIEATCKNFFGPTGVSEEMRGLGLGRALLQSALEDLRARGYGYAIIGDAGPTGFYERFCGATVIEDSSPGIYKGLLRETGR